MRMWTGILKLRTGPMGNSCEHSNEPVGSQKGKKFPDWLSDYHLIKDPWLATQPTQSSEDYAHTMIMFNNQLHKADSLENLRAALIIKKSPGFCEPEG